MGRDSAGGAAQAGRGAATRVGATEGIGNLRPINAYIARLPDSQRGFARGYVSVLTRGASAANVRTTGANAGLSENAMNTIERNINSRARRLADRRRGPNR